MLVRSLFTLALLTTAAFAQTPGTSQPSAQPSQHPPMAETPNTDIYYRLAPDALRAGRSS